MLNVLRTRATACRTFEVLQFEQLFAAELEGVPSLSAGSKPVYVATVIAMMTEQPAPNPDPDRRFSC
jgi:hypothetical protein